MPSYPHALHSYIIIRLDLLMSVFFCSTILHGLSAAVPITSVPTPSASNQSELNLWSYLPQNWSNLCTVAYDVDRDVNATITCHVTHHQRTRWRLADFREALSSVVLAQGLEIAVKIQCETGGTISLPFPFRAPGLVKLTVHNCRLLDKWADFATPAQELGDWLRVQDLRNCTWVNDPAELQLVMLNLDKMNSHYECGQDSSLVYNIAQNMRQEDMHGDHQALDPSVGDINQSDPDIARLSGSTGGNGTDLLNALDDVGLELALTTDGNWRNRLNTSEGFLGAIGNTEGNNVNHGNSTEETADDVLQTLIDLDKVKASCVFEQLEVHDESFSQDTNRNHFEFMVKDSVFPKLRLLNFTGIGLTEIPLEFRESRRKFHGSKLGVIDISHNYVQDLGIIPVYPSHGVPTRLIVRHNNITRINLKMLQELAWVPDFTVDLHGNPVACPCEMKEFLGELQNDKLWENPGMKYYREHVSALTCATPAELSGRPIGSLSADQLLCPVSPADLRPAMIVLLVIVVILLGLLALAVKFRKEVRILIYTRVHILLPCGHPRQPSDSAPEKTYDAFVAYAHQDSDWVLGSLLKRLEEPTGSPRGRRPCKLCIHQRDFVVGKPIIDNIVDCIAASRHTIVVLTSSFVKSGWAMEELEHAYRQSIEERRRHLVLVVLEEVPQSQMGAVLRRCCKTFTYLQVSDTFFWDRLLYSIQVTDNSVRSRKRPALSIETDEDDSPSAGTVNRGYNSDKETVVTGPSSPSLGEDFKRALFLETMRTLSVESNVSETTVPVTPSQVQCDRPLFKTAA